MKVPFDGSSATMTIVGDKMTDAQANIITRLVEKNMRLPKSDNFIIDRVAIQKIVSLLSKHSWYMLEVYDEDGAPILSITDSDYNLDPQPRQST